MYGKPKDKPWDLGLGRDLWTGYHSAVKVREDMTPVLNVDGWSHVNGVYAIIMCVQCR
jgi:hypothetical protein